MRTLYVKRARLEKDVLGQYVSGVRTNLMRATVNRLRKIQWEWVGTSKVIALDDLAQLDRRYSLILREDADFELRKGQP